LPLVERALPKQRRSALGVKHQSFRQTSRASGAQTGGHRTVSFWSADVIRHSNALDLEADVFTLDDPREIARSLKRSAEASQRRKSPPFKSAMSMLTFYINRAGKNLSDERKQVLERAKNALRKEFGRRLDE
jgi:hypothetical protein